MVVRAAAAAHVGELNFSAPVRLRHRQRAPRRRAPASRAVALSSQHPSAHVVLSATGPPKNRSRRGARCLRGRRAASGGRGASRPRRGARPAAGDRRCEAPKGCGRGGRGPTAPRARGLPRRPPARPRHAHFSRVPRRRHAAVEIESAFSHGGKPHAYVPHFATSHRTLRQMRWILQGSGKWAPAALQGC